MAEKITIPMSKVKQTKNCWRYEAIQRPDGIIPAVDCIYLQKTVLGEKPAPDLLVVEVQLP